MRQTTNHRPVAEEVLEKLLVGSKRFVEGNLLHPNHCQESRQSVMHHSESVAHLHTPLVIVMGHSSCGAITAVANGASLGGHMATLAPPIQTAIKNIKDTEGDLIENASKEVACISPEVLRHRSRSSRITLNKARFR